MLSDVYQPILEQVFGFQRLRPGQADIIEAILQRNHVLGVMPTGAGKSLCYQLPALVLDGLTLVVSPLVALMNDQVAALRLSGVAAETINGNRSRSDNLAAWQQVSAGHAKLLYLAPERMMQPRMIASLQRLPINLIAVDEAHCISKWGPAFRPDYVGLSQLGAVSRSSDCGIHCHRGPRNPTGHLREAVQPFGPGVQPGFRSPQHSPCGPAPPESSTGAAGIREFPSRTERHRLLPVPEVYGEDGCAAAFPRRRCLALPCWAGSIRTP